MASHMEWRLVLDTRARAHTHVHHGIILFDIARPLTVGKIAPFLCG